MTEGGGTVVFDQAVGKPGEAVTGDESGRDEPTRF